MSGLTALAWGVKPVPLLLARVACLLCHHFQPVYVIVINAAAPVSTGMIMLTTSFHLSLLSPPELVLPAVAVWLLLLAVVAAPVRLDAEKVGIVALEFIDGTVPVIDCAGVAVLPAVVTLPPAADGDVAAELLVPVLVVLGGDVLPIAAVPGVLLLLLLLEEPLAASALPRGATTTGAGLGDGTLGDG